MMVSYLQGYYSIPGNEWQGGKPDFTGKIEVKWSCILCFYSCAEKIRSQSRRQPSSSCSVWMTCKPGSSASFSGAKST